MSTKMSKSKNTNVKSRTLLEMEIGFSKEQKDILEKLMREKISECVDNIMNSDSEGDDFEGDRDSFNSLFDKVFTFKSLKEEDNVKEKKMRKSKKTERDPNMPKKNKTPYFMWLWNEEPKIGMSKIKKDFPELTHTQALSKAGKIWNEMILDDKQVFTDLSLKDKARYEKEMVDYNPPSSVEANEEIKVVELKKKDKKKKSSSVDTEEVDTGEVDADEEIEVVELKKKGKKKKSSSVETEEVDTGEVDEEIEVVELKKKGKKKKSSSVDTEEVDEDEEIEVKEELEGFERKDNLFLYGYTKKTGSTKFDTLNEAVSALQNDDEATGIVKDSNKHYTIRKGNAFKHTPTTRQPEICWKIL
jgi:hypothetical protein